EAGQADIRQFARPRAAASQQIAASAPEAPARRAGTADGSAQGQKTAPLGSGEWITPTSVATLANANKRPVTSKRRSMIPTSAQPHTTAVRMKPLPRTRSVPWVSAASPVKWLGEARSADRTPRV